MYVCTLKQSSPQVSRQQNREFKIRLGEVESELLGSVTEMKRLQDQQRSLCAQKDVLKSEVQQRDELILHLRAQLTKATTSSASLLAQVTVILKKSAIWRKFL